LEGRLKNLDFQMELAEVEKSLADLKEQKKGVKTLTEGNLAPASGLSKIDREIRLLTKKRQLIKKRFPLERENMRREIGLLAKKRDLYQERLPLERTLFVQELAVMKERLGTPISSGHAPREGILVAPIGGHVIWASPDLREGSELAAKTPVFTVGVMDPMLIRARVHEIEAVQLNPGDRAEFTLESLPGKTYEATVSRMSWTSLTPRLRDPSYYEVELTVANPDLVLREGLRGRVVFRKAEKAAK
jgi:hypothetical protein